MNTKITAERLKANLERKADISVLAPPDYNHTLKHNEQEIILYRELFKDEDLKEFRPIWHRRDFDHLCGPRLIEVAYQRILGRDPDIQGFSCYLKALRSGSIDTAGFLARLALSKEGKERGVKIRGIWLRLALERAAALPLFGWFFRYIRAIWLLPDLLRRLSFLEVSCGEHDLLRRKDIDNRIVELTSRLEQMETSRESLESRFSTLHELHVDIDNRIVELTSRLEQMETSRESLDAELKDHFRYVNNRLAELSLGLNLLKASNFISPPSETPSSRRSFFGDDFYAAFEDTFRSPPEILFNELAVYIPVIQKAKAGSIDAPVIDLGCGSGDWLRLLRQHGLMARGIDLNPIFLSRCRENDLDVEENDALEALRNLPNTSVGAITAFHLIEHLPPEAFGELLVQAARVLKPEGVAIFETPNPRNILVASGDFYRDLTHLRPIFPDTMAFCGLRAGFASSDAYFFGYSKGRRFLIPASTVCFNSIEDYVTVSRDYAWIGVKSL